MDGFTASSEMPTDYQSIPSFSLSPISVFTYGGDGGTFPLLSSEHTTGAAAVERDFLSQAERFDNKPSYSDDLCAGYLSFTVDECEVAVTPNLNLAFSMVTRPFNGFIQFWSAEQSSSSRHVLTTLDQPYKGHSDFKQYRKWAENYQYSITAGELQDKENQFIISGAPANAFINRLAEIVPNMRVHEENPLMLSALSCGLMCYFVLPIFDPSQNKCVGVVECCIKEFECLLEIFSDLVNALKKTDLRTFQGESLLCKTKDGLKCATDDMVEIEDALKTACISHGLTLAQVSIANEDSNDVPYSPSLGGKHMKQMIALKMTWLCPDSEDYDFKDYCGTCDMLPLNIGEGLVGKLLQNNEPHFCKNIYNELKNKQPMSFEPITNTKCSCFVICLKSTKTDVDYVFEFLWLRDRKYTVLIERLILTLKVCLPNFKLASRAELGDELRVVEVGNSSKDEIGSFQIFQGEKLSPIAEMLENERIHVPEQCIAPLQAKDNTSQRSLTQEEIEKHYGKKQEEAAEHLGVSLSTLKRERKRLGLVDWIGVPKGVKRKANPLCKNQSAMNEEVNKEILGPVTIKADYAGDTIIVHLPPSRPKFKNVQKQIANKLNLDPGSFKLKYRDVVEEYILLLSDEDMMEFIKFWRSGDTTTIKLFVISK